MTSPIRTPDQRLRVFVSSTLRELADERALRPSVVHRKVTGGFRSAWGAQAYAALASVIDTAQQRGQPVFATLIALMGHPVLPYLAAPGT